MGEHSAEQSSAVDYDDYIHELPERYGSASIIKHVEMLQKHAHSSWGESQLKDVQRSTQELLDGFRSEAAEQGLIHQLVTLEGDGIKIPQMSVDPRNGHYIVTHEDVPGLNNETFVRYQKTHEVMGLFVGFGLTFAETAPDSKRYRPQFVYQVSTGMTVQTPHGPVPLYTTGVVGETNLKFLEDERRDTIAESANELYSLVASERRSIHRVVETVMTKHHEDGSLWRHLGYHADIVAAGAPNERKGEVEDALTVLIASTFANDQHMLLLTDEHIRQFDDKSKEREYYRGEDEMSLVDGEFRGVIFLRADDTDSAARLNMVVGRPGEVVFVPMVRISEYDRG